MAMYENYMHYFFSPQISCSHATVKYLTFGLHLHPTDLSCACDGLLTVICWETAPEAGMTLSEGGANCNCIDFGTAAWKSSRQNDYQKHTGLLLRTVSELSLHIKNKNWKIIGVSSKRHIGGLAQYPQKCKYLN